jgi:hypothetical protein
MEKRATGTALCPYPLTRLTTSLRSLLGFRSTWQSQVLGTKLRHQALGRWWEDEGPLIA